MTKKQGCMGVCAALLAVVAVCDAALAQGGYPGRWAGKWIWIQGDAHPVNSFLMARGSMELEAAPRAGRVHVTAADRYVLYLNGQYLGRGPARSDARWTSYDSYDVGSHLHAGKNTIAVLAYHYGYENAYTRDARAGLFVQWEVTRADGTRQTMGTDGRWRVRQALGWSRDVELINGAVGFTEVYDANADPPDWAAPFFDDSGWAPAYVIPQRQTPWSYLEPRQTPMMREVEIFPAKLMQVGEAMELTAGIFKDANVPQRLAAEPLYRLEFAKVSDAEAVLRATAGRRPCKALLSRKGKARTKVSARLT